MGLVTPKIFLTVLVLLIGMSLMIGRYWGLVEWGRLDYACYPVVGGPDKHFYKEVDRQMWMSIGRLQLYYQPLTYGCEEERRYDPAQFKVVDNALVPKK